MANTIWPLTAILLDCDLPQLNGLDTLKRLKAINPNVPILMVSGLQSNRSAAMEAGADAFIVKPYDLSELLSWLHLTLVNPTPET